MEITKTNFADELPNITKNIKKASFIGFDAEFTAILAGDAFKHRLFDTSEDRYNKIKGDVSKMLITQIGLTMFEYVRDQDMYIATGYTFHLCPQAFGDVDQSFIFQASTLKFLCKHNFNFNKFTYEGLPFLSEAEETKVHQQIKDKTLYGNLLRALEMNDEKQLQQYCSAVSKWLTLQEEDTMYLDIDNPILRYLVHNELRLRFPEVLTTDSLGNSNKVLIYRDKNVEGANNAPMTILEENLLNSLLGFSQIIKLLATHKKPLIGHNMFLDVILLHNQFIGPLPNSYNKFKNNIIGVFPRIYDTKFISHEMSRKLTFDEVWKSNALQDLYEFFSEAKCKKLQNGVHLIRLSTPFNVKQSYHEAGWDSYCSGYCFLRLGQWAASANSGARRPAAPAELAAALAACCNNVNVIRGAVPFMNLSGADPPRNRPDLLHIKAIQDRIINIGQVTAVLSSFGNIDIKPYGTRTALIAANSQHTVDRILKNFKDSKEYRISLYSYRYTVAGRVVMWGGAFITGSLVLFLINKKMKVIS